VLHIAKDRRIPSSYLDNRGAKIKKITFSFLIHFCISFKDPKEIPQISKILQDLFLKG